jgi:hypothetical protein
MHVHERRPRLLKGDVVAWVEVLLFRCQRVGCRAVWRILPVFLARHLPRTWTCVGIGVGLNRSNVPTRTRRRWRERLRHPAAVLRVLLARSGISGVVNRVLQLRHEATRGELVEVFGGLSKLAEISMLIHHLCPGVRLM